MTREDRGPAIACSPLDDNESEHPWSSRRQRYLSAELRDTISTCVKVAGHIECCTTPAQRLPMAVAVL